MTTIRIKTMLSIFLGVVCVFGTSGMVYGDEEGIVGYDVQAILPDNQVTKDNSFFDLRMTPSAEQTISIQINNTSDEESTYDLSVHQAYTNNQGFIDYDQVSETVKDKEYDIAKIASIADSVTLPGNSSKTVPITIQMPKASYDGQIMAGIQVVKQEDTQDKGQISNRYGYIIGLKLTETDNEVPRQLILETVEPAVSFGTTSVIARLFNPTRDAYGHLVYDANITDAKDKKTIKAAHFDTDMQMAPMSTYDFAIDWKGERLKAGKYVLHLTVTDAKDNKWEFEEPFTITAEAAKKINAATIDQVTDKGLPSWVYILIGLLLACVLIGSVFIIAKRKKDKK